MNKRIILHMMKLPDPIKTRLCDYDYSRRLLRNGYKSLGFGSFGEVFGRENGQDVIKVGCVNSDGYIPFLRYVGMRSSNPHLPYIKKLEIFDTDPASPYSNPYYVVRMERLSGIADLARDSLTASYDEMGITDLNDLAEPQNLTPKTRAMVYIKRMLIELYEQYAQDIKFGNVLFRDRTLVITDPVSCYIGSG